MKVTDAANFWNQRYKNNATVYGWQPNIFFKEYLDKAEAGTLLLPCEGEGRNAIYAAKKGWQVSAFDFSSIAVEKALQKANEENVSINYIQKSIEEYIPERQYQLIASIYVHIAEPSRKLFHQQLIASLQPKGTILLEAFHKNQINHSSGGPQSTQLLYSKEELMADFSGLTITLLEEKDIYLTEGAFHNGHASVIRMIANN